MSQPKKPPAYRRRVVRGKPVAYVTLRDCVTGSRRDYWLGPYGSSESRQAYARLIAEWENTTAKLPSTATSRRGRVTLNGDLTIDELIERYWEGVAAGYSTSHQYGLRTVLEVVSQLYGHTPAIAFGPIALRTVREAMVKGDPGDPSCNPPRRPRPPWCRRTVNSAVHRIRAVFRWAVSHELLPSSVYEALRTVEALRAGRTPAAESLPVTPVELAHVKAVHKLVSRQVWAMIRLQLYTGMRPGEVCRLRPCDLDTSNERTWVWQPAEHKTAYHNKRRVILFGPKAVKILRRYLIGRRIDAPLFSPAEAEARRRAKLHAERRTPMSCGNRPGSNVSASPKRAPGARYTVDSYRRSIQRACDLADRVKRREYEEATGKVAPPDVRFVPRWHPHQLRHTYATRVRAQYGLEAAQILLGHSSALVTDAVYAERDMAKAQKIAQQIG